MIKATVYKYTYDGDYHKVPDCKGLAKFHAWGQETIGDHTFPVAVVERENGVIVNIPSNMIRFHANPQSA